MYSNKWGGRVPKAQAYCILKECCGGQLELECMRSKREGHFWQFLRNPKLCISNLFATPIEFVWEHVSCLGRRCQKFYEFCIHDLSLWGTFMLALWFVFVLCVKFCESMQELLHYMFLQSLKQKPSPRPCKSLNVEV